MKLDYHYESVYGSSVCKVENQVDVVFTDENLQAALYKWLEYKEKFSSDSGEYVAELLKTLRLGLTTELENIDFVRLAEIGELPFN